MPRPFCRRRIGWLPRKWCFLPEGEAIPSPEIITLNLDELEAIRLADFLGLYHEEAAQKMGVSRATFGRILESGRKKVAEALISGKILRIETGPAEIIKEFPFGHIHRGGEIFFGGKPMCPGRHRHRLGLGPEGFCFCPKCGFRKPHVVGVPCMQESCPHCGSRLIREGSGHHQLIIEKKGKKKE